MSLLTTLGMPELIGESPEEYVGRAASLARDLDRLEALRQWVDSRSKPGGLPADKAFFDELSGEF